MAPRFFLCLVLFGLFSFPVEAQEKKLSRQEIFQKCSPAIVLVYQLKEGSKPGTQSLQFGTGSIIHSKGIVVTNNHVVGTATEVFILLRGNAKMMDQNVANFINENLKHVLKAKVLKSYPQADIAFLQIQSDRTDFPTIPLGDSDKVDVGEDVVVIGHPRGFVWTMTTGIVSALRPDAVQTDAAINPGNSGGPLLNQEGKMLGVNTYIIKESQNLGFARSVNLVKLLMKLQKDQTSAPGSSNPEEVVRALMQASLLDDIVQVGEGEKANYLEMIQSFFSSSFFTSQKIQDFLVWLKDLVKQGAKIYDFKIQGTKALVTLYYFALNDQGQLERKEFSFTLNLFQGDWKVTSLSLPQKSLNLSPKPASTTQTPGAVFEKEIDTLWETLKKKDPSALSSFSLSSFSSSRDTLTIVSGKEGRLDLLRLEKNKIKNLLEGGWDSLGQWCIFKDHLYGTSTASGKLYRIDPFTGRDSVVGEDGWQNVYHLVSMGEYLYAIDSKLGVLMELNLSTSKVNRIADGYYDAALMVAVAPHLYIFSRKTGKVYQVHPETKKETLLVPEGWEAVGVGAVWQNKIYVTSRKSGKLFEIDPATGKDQALSEGWEAVSAMSAGSQGLYMASQNSGKVYCFNPSTKKETLVAENFAHPLQIASFSPQDLAHHNLNYKVLPYLAWALETKTHLSSEVQKDQALLEYSFENTAKEPQRLYLWVSRGDGKIQIQGVLSLPASLAGEKENLFEKVKKLLAQKEEKSTIKRWGFRGF